MAAAPPHALEVTPESALQFVLTRDGDDTSGGDGSSKCTMTLRHTGQTTQSIAFKVRASSQMESIHRGFSFDYCALLLFARFDHWIESSVEGYVVEIYPQGGQMELRWFDNMHRQTKKPEAPWLVSLEGTLGFPLIVWVAFVPKPTGRAWPKSPTDRSAAHPHINQRGNECHLLPRTKAPTNYNCGLETHKSIQRKICSF